MIISIGAVPLNSSLPFVSLDSLVFIDNSGNLGVFPEAITALYTKEVATDKNIFRKDGAFWLACYKGKQVRIHHTKGCYYIKELLCNPNKDIRAVSLQASIDKPPASQSDDEDKYKNMSSVEIENEGLAVHVESADDVIDLLTLKNSLKTIDSQISEAKKNGMTQKLSRLKKQKEGIKEFIRKNTNIKGESRKVPDTSEKARQAVKRTIETAYKNIGAAIAYNFSTASAKRLV